MKGFILCICVGVLALGGATIAVAAQDEDTPDDVQSLKQLIEEQQIRLEELFERLQAIEAKQEKAADDAAKAGWAQNISLKGDFRYRHELIDEEGKVDRNRQRTRARLAMLAKVNDAVTFDFGLATGSDSDPVSTNQTLAGGFTKKPVWIDRMAFAWAPPGATDVKIIGGRMSKPFFIPGNQQLIWDGDLSMEGLALNYAPMFGSTQLMMSIGDFWIEERSSSPDSKLLVAQLGFKHTFPGGASNLIIGGSYFDYSNVKTYTPFVDSTKGFGNTTLSDEDGGKTYAFDYKPMEFFLEYNTTVGVTPLQIYGDYVVNREVDEDDTGWMAGFTYGKLKDPRTWAFRYNYRRLEKDAVVGAFCDSDFIGGGTNGEGHCFGFDYQVSKNVAMALTYFVNDKPLVDSKEYKRGQLDFNYKF